MLYNPDVQHLLFDTSLFIMTVGFSIPLWFAMIVTDVTGGVVLERHI